uniref:Uncharacterized protein n=1 Tax=Arundo donax TaxID=35708 RepID=A0A0A9GPV1_ARUDO
MIEGKSIADKNVEGASNSVAISEASTEPNIDHGKELSNDVTPGSTILSQVNAVTCIESRPLMGDKAMCTTITEKSVTSSLYY